MNVIYTISTSTICEDTPFDKEKGAEEDYEYLARCVRRFRLALACPERKLFVMLCIDRQLFVWEDLLEVYEAVEFMIIYGFS